MPASPDETSATDRPSAARSSASRARASSSPIVLSCRRLPAITPAEQIEIEPVADDFVGRRKQRRGLRGPPSRIAGAVPTIANRPRARPIAPASIGVAAPRDRAGRAT